MSQTLTRVKLPVSEPSVNVRALSHHAIERITGITTTTITLTNEYAPPVVVRWNGVALDPASDFTLVGRTLTLAAAPVVGDTIEYHGYFKAQHG